MGLIPAFRHRHRVAVVVPSSQAISSQVIPEASLKRSRAWGKSPGKTSGWTLPLCVLWQVMTVSVLPVLPEVHLESVAHEDVEAPRYEGRELHEGVVGSAVGLDAPSPPVDSLLVDAEGVGEGVPGEAAGLPEPFESLREVPGQDAAQVGCDAAGDDDAETLSFQRHLVSSEERHSATCNSVVFALWCHSATFGRYKALLRTQAMVATLVVKYTPL